MSRSRTLWVVGAFLAAAVAGVVARLWLWPVATAEIDVEQADTPAAVAVTEELVLEPADLYFPSRQGGLKLHRQDLPAGEPLQRVEALVQALIDGPAGVADADLFEPLPAGTALSSVYVLKNGAVALDLRSPAAAARSSQDESTPEGDESAESDEVSSPPPAGEARPAWGSRDELVAVYSLVNTVTLNRLDGIERVVLLWDGRQPETFAGHLDLSRPLAADRSWVVSAPSP